MGLLQTSSGFYDTCLKECVPAQTLSELQDRLPPFPTEIALQLIEEDLGVPVSAIMSTITPEPVAAASLGQVLAHAAALPYPSPPTYSARTFRWI